MIETDDLFSFEEEENNARTGIGNADEAYNYQKDLTKCHEELLRAHAENENQRKRFKKEIDNAY